jgi:hypothetical protein
MASPPSDTSPVPPTTLDPAVASAAAAEEWHTYLFNRASWGAIIAGVVAALVVQLLLNLLGLGIGAASLSAANPADNPSASSFSIGAGFWWTISGIIASFCGGVVAGRLCGAAKANTARWHGFVSWCATTLVLFYLLTSALGGVVGGTFNTLGSALGGVGRTAASAVSGVAQNADTGNLEAEVRSLINPSDAQSVQANLVAYIRASVNGDQQAAQAAREQAVNSLARVANVSPDEARNRLGQVEQRYRQAVQQAKQQAADAAEVARNGAARAGIFGFVALVLGAIAAWFGGGLGTPRRPTMVAGTARRAF